jgi:hypothetical protein
LVAVLLRLITRLVLLLVLGVLAPGEVAASAPVRVWPPAAQSEKLASWGCDPETAVLRQAATMQAAETQQAASSLGYETASVLSLAAERAFPSGGDRLLGTLGPARLNHADELASTIQRIEGAGGTVDFRAGNLAFSPSRGAPGRVILDPNASISAVRHEAGHFFDDIGLGSPGMGYYMQNPSVRWASERSSYLREIRAARLLGDQNARRMLIQDAAAEKAAIFGR